MLQCTRMVPLGVISIPMHWGSLSLLRSHAMFVGSVVLKYLYLQISIYTWSQYSILKLYTIYIIVMLYTTFNIVVIGSELHKIEEDVSNKRYQSQQTTPP